MPGKQRTELTGEVITASCFLGFFVLWLVLAFAFPKDARLFPIIVSGAGSILSLMVLLAVGKLPPAEADTETLEGSKVADTKELLPRGTVALLGFPAYYLMVTLVGFHVVSILLIMVMPFLMGYRRPVPLFVIGLVTVLVVSYSFSATLQVRLPQGIIGNWIIATWITPK